MIETYLDQSVQGIEVGSKVKYRGVPIGNIRRINFTGNHYTKPDRAQPTKHSYVMLEIELTSLPFSGMTEDTLRQELPTEVKHGLRARLTSQGVTGTSYLEIDYLDPEKYPPLPIDWEPDHPYIPSAQSAFSRIVSSAEDVFNQLQSIDFIKIANGVERLIDSIDRKVEQVPLDKISTNAAQLLTEVRDSNRQIQQLLGRPEINSALKDLAGAVASFRRTAEAPALTNSVIQLERTLRRLDQVVAGKDDDLGAALSNLRTLTENLKELSENAKRFPAYLFFGEPPRPSKHSP
jgi:ABC-type transporter Mla subunit MlaD